MKYTREQVSDAILICDIAASETRVKYGIGYGTVQRELDLDPIASELAQEAWFEATRFAFAPDWEPWFDAEAAQLLREGWRP